MKSLRQMVPNANALLVFESAARLASFTRAAEELGISQPAVTRHVRTVEQAVGRTLFERNHNRLRLTDDGRRLLTSVADGFGQVAQTLEALRSERRRRRLVFAAHAGFAQQWLMPRFSELCELLADFEVRLMISDSSRELDRGDYDFAVRVGDGTWRDQESRLLVPEVVTPVAAPGFLAEHPQLRRADAEALRRAPLLHMDEGDKPWMTWRAWFRAQGIAADPPRPEVLYHNYPLVLQEVLAGKGVALGWRPLTDRLICQGALVPVGARVANPSMGYHLSWPDRPPARDLARSIRRWFDAHLSGDFS